MTEPRNEDNFLVSIIVRTKNEERWIDLCLKSIFEQSYKNIEVIVVDNESTDQTVAKATKWPVKIKNFETTDRFRPGLAINEGIRVSSGEVLVIISGHCIATNEVWLENLIKPLSNPNIAGVYGRQQPMSFTSSIDKRDLLTTFGLDPKLQVKDTFFHNANSAIPRNVWDAHPFDEDCTNIEDRIWGGEVIKAGFNLYYEPEASVYHWHGINHELNEKRAKSIVSILDRLPEFENDKHNSIEPSDVKTCAIIPFGGDALQAEDKSLLEITYNQLSHCQNINQVFISTTHEASKTISFCPAENILKRSDDLFEEVTDISEIILDALEKIEAQGKFFDAIITCDQTYPFRDPAEIDMMLRQFIHHNLDTMIPTIREQRSIWREDGSGEEFSEVTEKMIPTALKDVSNFVGLVGYAFLTRPALIRTNQKIGKKFSLFQLDEHASSISVKNQRDASLFSSAITAWNS